MFIDRFLQRWRMAKVVPYIPEGAKVLDIGCSNGELFEILGDKINNSLGIDPFLSETVIGKRYRLLKEKLSEQIITQSEKFDVITMLAVIEHLSEDILIKCNSICSDLLYSGGYVIITVPSKYVDPILVTLKFMRLADGIKLDEHHGFEVSMVKEIFSKDSFKMICHKKFQLGLNNLFVLQKH